MGRVACMGHDVLSLLNCDVPILNIQKGRVDYILDVMTREHLRARPEEAAPFMARQDIIPLVAQEADLTWLRLRPPLAVYMDSYSELTDQLFVHRSREWRFCCNYSDVQHSAEFESLFQAMGLLPVEDFLMYYRRFFFMLRKRWGAIPVVFLHFPTTLDARSIFQSRSMRILECISQVAQQFPPFYSLTVDPESVDWPETKVLGLERFPYHYSEHTYRELAEQVRLTRVFEDFERGGNTV